MSDKSHPKLLAVLIGTILVAASGCTERVGAPANDRQTVNSIVANSNGVIAQPTRQRSFAEDLEYIRGGRGFKQVLVLTRQDEADFTADDVEYLTRNQPQQTNQRLFSEGRKRIIVGTNFLFEPKHFEALRQRFQVEDYTNR